MVTLGTPIDPATPYFPRGKREILFVPAIADVSAPTLIELNATDSTNLSSEITAVTGFDRSVADVPVPTLGNRFTGNVPGEITSSASSLQFQADTKSADVRDLLPEGKQGFIVILPEGSDVGTKMNVFPVQVSAASPDPDMTTFGAITVSFSITRAPAMNVPIPTA